MYTKEEFEALDVVGVQEHLDFLLHPENLELTIIGDFPDLSHLVRKKQKTRCLFLLCY